MNNKREKEKDTKEIVFWRSLVGGGSLFGGGILLLIFAVPLLTPESIQVIVARGIAEALLIAGVFHFFYEIVIRRKFKNEIAITVSEAVNADVDFLKEKLKGNVDSIIKNCLQAKLCNAELAGIFFDGLIDPYISIDKFRRKFIYDITLNSLDHDIKSDGIVLKRTAYFKVVEELTYKKQLSVKKGAKFMIGLCLNDPQLEFYKSSH